MMTALLVPVCGCASPNAKGPSPGPTPSNFCVAHAPRGSGVPIVKRGGALAAGSALQSVQVIASRGPGAARAQQAALCGASTRGAADLLFAREGENANE